MNISYNKCSYGRSSGGHEGVGIIIEGKYDNPAIIILYAIIIVIIISTVRVLRAVFAFIEPRWKRGACIGAHIYDDRYESSRRY